MTALRVEKYSIFKHSLAADDERAIINNNMSRVRGGGVDSKHSFNTLMEAHLSWTR